MAKRHLTGQRLPPLTRSGDCIPEPCTKGLHPSVLLLIRTRYSDAIPHHRIGSRCFFRTIRRMLLKNNSWCPSCLIRAFRSSASHLTSSNMVISDRHGFCHIRLFLICAPIRSFANEQNKSDQLN